MEPEKETVSAAQGAQPTLGTLRIGIIAVARHDGVAKARLLLRPASGDEAVTLTEGSSLTVPGHGLLTLEQVSTEGKGAVSLSLAPAV
ncbi:hypothetical protein CVV68_06920 [Arthrobacter livingstonensis]|uniref:Uncharacterized protein n=1 Tax=Arthrobacter livingstonensis TaxID=670078 RepID=A0A2V5M0H3_9MICC|nr:hypothetical protein [Arthrobacter livingstonensis]PYI68526.1 hypothetical protein CVV68_06920 [Arthrobacter livingstonensis]